MALQMTWQPSLLNQKRKKGLPLGLKNLGNTCYLNSVLQCLTYTPPLANFCLKNQHSAFCDLARESDRKRECPFCILEKRIVRSLSIDLTLDTPSKINSCLRIFAEHFRSGRQEDAHEFLRYVIDACHNTCLRLKKLQQQRRKGGLKNGGECFNGSSVVKEIFGGALQSQVKCLSCGNESNKIDDIMDISLDVWRSSSLKDALQKFFQPEVLDGNNKYNCENCKKLVKARKQMSIFQAPNVLVIQLKRFEGMYGGKIDKAIAFEEILVLSSYMCKASQQDPHPEYNLFGTIVHSGYSPDSGHYYAYIKDAVGHWYCCNDSYVSLSTLQEVLSEKVYILFFSRTKQRPVPGSTVLASNGVKSQDCNGRDAFKSPMVANLKKADANQIVDHSSEKNNVTKSKVDKVLSIPQMKLSTIGNYGIKRFPVTVNLKIAHKSQPEEQNGAVKASTCLDKSERGITSSIHSNGVSKSRNAVDNENGQAFPLANGNGKIQSIHINSVETEMHEESDTRNRVAIERGPNLHKLQNGGVNCSTDISGCKRKLPDQDSCILFAKDDKSLAKLEEFKQFLRKDASLVLRSCGWLDEVYSYMRDRKKRCTREVSGMASKSNSNQSKRLLITDAKQNFLSQIPESLKENLIEQLRSFSQERQCSGC